MSRETTEIDKSSQNLKKTNTNNLSLVSWSDRML